MALAAPDRFVLKPQREGGGTMKASGLGTLLLCLVVLCASACVCVTMFSHVYQSHYFHLCCVTPVCPSTYPYPVGTPKALPGQMGYVGPLASLGPTLGWACPEHLSGFTQRGPACALCYFPDGHVKLRKSNGSGISKSSFKSFVLLV